MKRSLNIKPCTVQLAAYILQDSMIDEETIIYFSKSLAKDTNTSPELAKEFKKIKTSLSKISPNALREILILFEMEKKKVNECVRVCDFGAPEWLTDPFVLSAEKQGLDDWKIPKPKNESPLSPQEIWQRGYAAINILKELIGQIKTDSPDAADVCTKITIKMVETINTLKNAKPKLFEKIAKGKPQWPVLRSRHPFYCEAEDVLLADVGKSYEFIIDSSAKWNPNDPGTKVAMDLYFYLDDLRDKANAFINMEIVGMEKKKILAERPWINQVAMLKEFNRDSALDWWRLAVIFLKDSYPEPNKVTMLANVANTKQHYRANTKRSSGILSPGNFNRDIFHNIKGKFISLAGR